MEESLKENPRDVNALTLAYLGDAVFELEVRKRLYETGSHKVEKLHKRTTGIVNASSQSAFIGKLEQVLTEEEISVYHRGRNSKTLTAAKHQKITDYRRATGFEAVFGYLFLKGDTERIAELMDICFSDIEAEE